MNTKTVLNITLVNSIELGRCITQVTYKVKSLNKPLSNTDLQALHDMGMLGYGQSYTIKRAEVEPTEDGCNRHYVAIVTNTVDSSD